MNKKILAIALCLLLTLSLCACGVQGTMQRFAKTCWNDIGMSSIEPDCIYVMEYTTRTALSDDLLETDMYYDIPARGYAVLFHTYGITNGEAFMDSYAYFLDENGKIIFSFDYEENLRLYEMNYSNFSIYNIEAGEKALEYLTNCNYIGGMINFAYEGEVLESKMETNIWYSFTDEMIEKVTK